MAGKEGEGDAGVEEDSHGLRGDLDVAEEGDSGGVLEGDFAENSVLLFDQDARAAFAQAGALFLDINNHGNPHGRYLRSGRRSEAGKNAGGMGGAEEMAFRRRSPGFQGVASMSWRKITPRNLKPSRKRVMRVFSGFRRRWRAARVSSVS